MGGLGSSSAPDATKRFGTGLGGDDDFARLFVHNGVSNGRFRFQMRHVASCNRPATIEVPFFEDFATDLLREA